MTINNLKEREMCRMTKEDLDRYNKYCDQVDIELDQKERVEHPDAFPEGFTLVTFIVIAGIVMSIVVLLICILQK